MPRYVVCSTQLGKNAIIPQRKHVDHFLDALEYPDFHLPFRVLAGPAQVTKTFLFISCG